MYNEGILKGYMHPYPRIFTVIADYIPYHSKLINRKKYKKI